MSPSQAAGPAPFGPDVSSWQHPSGAAIDWGKVKAAGSSFAIIKATEGGGYTNPYFASDTAAARANKLAAGAYHFARPALPLSTAADQANRFAATLGNVRTAGTLPPILDLETTGGLNPGQLVTWTQIFTETLQAATGRVPMIYTYPYFWDVQMAGTAAFHRYPLWLASYRSTPPTPVGSWPAWAMWQYTASAAVPGIIGDTDMSSFAGDATSFAAFTNGASAPAPAPITAPAAPVGVSAVGKVRSAFVWWVPADDGGAVATSYTVTASPGGAQVTVPGTATSAVFGGLTEGTSYSFTVSATNGAGTSPASSSSAPVIARGDPPAAPASLGFSVGKGKVTLSWPANPGPTAVTSYVLTRCSPAPCTPTTTLATVAGTATSYVDTAVIGGVTYDYRLVAIGRWGSSGPSPVAQAMPLPTVDRLDTPSGVVAVGSPDGVRVAWAPVPSAARYQVLRCAGACVPAGTPVATVDIPAAQLTQKLPAGSTYTYAVKAIAGPIASAPSRPVTGTALIPQALGVALWPTRPRIGQPTTVSVRLTRTDTGAALGGRVVYLSFAPAYGPAPATIALRTSATGVASAVIRPMVNQVVSARSAARDLATVSTKASVVVSPVLSAQLSAPTVAVGGTVSLTGRTSPMFAGERVFRQMWYRTYWRMIDAAPVARDGSYRFVVPAAGGAGAQKMRIFIGQTPRHLGGPSGMFTLTTLAPSGATPAPGLTVRLSALSVPRGGRVLMTGSTSSAYAGERVFRQMWFRTYWRMIDATVVARDGSYRFVVPAASGPGRQAFRIFMRPSPRHPALASAQAKLLTVPAALAASDASFVTARLSSLSVPRGGRVLMTGSTSSAYAGERVFRQMWFRTYWRMIDATVVARDGSYRFVVPAASGPGRQAFRIFMRPSPRHPALASAQAKLLTR